MNLPGKKYQLSSADYERFQTLILKRTGMLFSQKRNNALSHGVLSIAGKNGYKNLQDYYMALRQTATDSEIWDDMINELTVGETYFFRDPAQFKVLRENILAERISCHRHDRRLRIWSAGCATGEEPYSIAILLSRLLLDIDKWNIFILATDINKQVLHKARKGIFREWSFRQTGGATRARYFSAQAEKCFEIDPRLKKMVIFSYLNLSEDCYPSLSTNTNAMDLILCRNVAIYQSDSVMKEVTDRFYRSLVPGGWLMVGAAETAIPVFDQFSVQTFSGNTVYQKIAAPLYFVEDSSAQPLVEPVPGTSIPASELPLDPGLPRPISETEPGSQSSSIEAGTLPYKGAEDHYREGLNLLTQHLYEEAMAAFQACIALEPGHARGLYQMARVLANMGQLEQARALCGQAIEIEPLMVEAHYTLALIYQEQGNVEDAVSQLKKALYLAPDFVLAHFSMANFLQQKKREKEMARHRSQAIRLASKMSLEDVLPGSDDLTAGQMLTMVKAVM